MDERGAIDRLRQIATDPAARGLRDDAALLEGWVITHDTIAEGVHFLSADPPASVGWKLVAVNLSDLAAKGAEPRAALLSLTLTQDGEWERGFLDGIEAACESYGLALIGGDTIALPQSAPRVFGLTAIGRAGPRTPGRDGARPGDRLWLIGTVGDSAAGLALLKATPEAAGPLVDVYRRPVPLVAAGMALAPNANAMIDISDGLLLDALRLAEASGCSAKIELDTIPLSRAFAAERGTRREARMFAATGGDDYALLVALPKQIDPLSLSLPKGSTVAAIGTLATEGYPLSVTSGGRPVRLPERLGYEHRGNSVPSLDDRR